MRFSGPKIGSLSLSWSIMAAKSRETRRPMGTPITTSRKSGIEIHQVFLAKSPRPNTIWVSSGCSTFNLLSNAENLGMMNVNRKMAKAMITTNTMEG